MNVPGVVSQTQGPVGVDAEHRAFQIGAGALTRQRAPTAAKGCHASLAAAGPRASNVS